MFSAPSSMISRNMSKLCHKLQNAKNLLQLTWPWQNKPWSMSTNYCCLSYLVAWSPHFGLNLRVGDTSVTSPAQVTHIFDCVHFNISTRVASTLRKRARSSGRTHSHSAHMQKTFPAQTSTLLVTLTIMTSCMSFPRILRQTEDLYHLYHLTFKNIHEGTRWHMP